MKEGLSEIFSLLVHYLQEDDMSKLSESLQNEVDTFNDEYESFNKGKKAPAARARKALQNIKGIAQSLRLEIQKQKLKM